MIHLFETVKNHPEDFKQLACKVLLCTQYDWPTESALQSLYSEHNFIVYVFKGKKVSNIRFFLEERKREVDFGSRDPGESTDRMMVGLQLTDNI